MTSHFILPALLLLAIAYFGIWENHDGPRQFSKDEFEDTLFLPLFTDETAPYDRYNLFSANHLSDYFNLMLMWSPACLLFLAMAYTTISKQVHWSNPLITISGTTFIFFLINPLLASCQDWGLFIVSGIILFPTLVFVYSHVTDKRIAKILSGPTLALVLASVPFHLVNANGTLLSERYRITGQRDFKTYWIGSSTTLFVSSEMKGDPSEQVQSLENTVSELEPFAVEGNDKEYANLLSELGWWYKNQGDEIRVLEFFRKAEPYSPNLGSNLYQLCIAEFETNNISRSQELAGRLVSLHYQPFDAILRMAIHISLADRNYQRAADFSVTYLDWWPNDVLITEVECRLRMGHISRLSLIYLTTRRGYFASTIRSVLMPDSPFTLIR